MIWRARPGQMGQLGRGQAIPHTTGRRKRPLPSSAPPPPLRNLCAFLRNWLVCGERAFAKAVGGGDLSGELAAFPVDGAAGQVEAGGLKGQHSADEPAGGGSERPGEGEVVYTV